MISDPSVLGRVIVFADELNKYAPKSDTSGRSLTTVLLEITERGRSLGAILFGAEQFRSAVRDNGTGIPTSDATGKLLNIGMSAKVYGKEAGFRGIGRLAGIAYCKRLEFRTTFAHEDEMTSITFDCDGIRQSICPSMKEVEELTDVLQEHTSQDLDQAKKDDHFFEVKMEGIDGSLLQFLDMGEMEKYLGQVLPVEYDAQRFLYATKIQRMGQRTRSEDPDGQSPTSKFRCGTRGVKLYKTHYKTKQKNFDIHVKDIRFYPDAVDAKSPFWMWYAATDLLGMFDDERVAGLRFRRNNIAIGGSERVAELFSGNEGRLNNWTMGETRQLIAILTTIDKRSKATL